MAELMVVGFKQDVRRASEVLELLGRSSPDWAVDLRDALAVYRDDNGRLLVDQSYRKTSREGAAWGGFFGAFLGALVVAPFTGGAASAAILAAALHPHREHDDPARRLGSRRFVTRRRSGSAGSAVRGIGWDRPAHDARRGAAFGS